MMKFSSGTETKEIFLPAPSLESNVSVETTLYKRISRRSFAEKPLPLKTLGQILWAAQGKNSDKPRGTTRTAPSAGATYPLDTYVVTGNIKNLPNGFYRYEHARHLLLPLISGDLRKQLTRIALGQQFITQAPASIILSAVFERTTRRYGDRGIQYVHNEIGHVTQNVYLQVESLGLGTVAVGAFDDKELKSLLKIDSIPLMIIPFGQISD